MHRQDRSPTIPADSNSNPQGSETIFGSGDLEIVGLQRLSLVALGAALRPSIGGRFALHTGPPASRLRVAGRVGRGCRHPG